MPTQKAIKTDKITKIDKIEVWPSNKIPYAYLQSNYYRKQGTLGNSCMRNKDMQKSLNFYVKNNVKIGF